MNGGIKMETLNHCMLSIPLRANYIKEKLDLESKSILDVGCGGGLLTEALYDSGANVTGIDAAGPGIEVAKIHASKGNKKNLITLNKLLRNY